MRRCRTRSRDRAIRFMWVAGLVATITCVVMISIVRPQTHFAYADSAMKKRAAQVCNSVDLELAWASHEGRAAGVQSFAATAQADGGWTPHLYPIRGRHWQLVLNPNHDAWLGKQPGEVLAVARWLPQESSSQRILLFHVPLSGGGERIVGEERWRRDTEAAVRALTWLEAGVVLSSTDRSH